MNLFAASEFWAKPAGSGEWWSRILIGLIISAAIFLGCMYAPTRARRWIIGAFTFAAASYYILLWAWPTPMNRKPLDLPANSSEKVGFWLNDATAVFKDFGTILPAFMLGLGVYSLLRIHLGKLVKRQKDWVFSLALLTSMVAMAFFGYWSWYIEQFAQPKTDWTVRANWGTAQFGRDFLFDGLLQQMDAAMFSIIAFFILSAAYRAFRIRSIEATIMLSIALIMMLNTMGIMQFWSSQLFDRITGGDPNSFWNNLKLDEVANWFKNQMQVPSLRALDFGVAIGAFAMAVRIWLNLEKGGTA